LEREKSLALRALKELEFDRAMGKVSEQDFTEMSTRLRARAARLLVQLDSAGGYRDLIEQEIEKRIARAGGPAPESAAGPGGPAPAAEPAALSCAGCGTLNDADARFCKNCGAGLRPPA
jgi:hypothetical protein